MTTILIKSENGDQIQVRRHKNGADAYIMIRENDGPDADAFLTKEEVWELIAALQQTVT